MRQGEVTLNLRALLLEVCGALDKDARVGMGAMFLGPAQRREPGQFTRGMLAIPLALRRQLRNLRVADRHDDRPAHGE